MAVIRYYMNCRRNLEVTRPNFLQLRAQKCHKWKLILSNLLIDIQKILKLALFPIPNIQLIKPQFWILKFRGINDLFQNGSMDQNVILIRRKIFIWSETFSSFQFGGILKLRRQDFAIFWPPSPLRRQVYYISLWKLM